MNRPIPQSIIRAAYAARFHRYVRLIRLGVPSSQAFEIVNQSNAARKAA